MKEITGLHLMLILADKKITNQNTHEIDCDELADRINQFFREEEKIMGKCDYCHKIHDLRIACPEYVSLEKKEGEGCGKTENARKKYNDI
jgi:hemerythrin